MELRRFTRWGTETVGFKPIFRILRGSIQSLLGNQKGRQMSEEKNLQGIGGWLILVAVGIVFTPIKKIMIKINLYPEIFSTGVWEDLTTQGNEAYSPLWAPSIIGEVLFSCGLIIVLLYMAYLFFTKSRNFPKWFVVIAIINVQFIAADAFIINMFLPSQSIFDPETIREFLRSVVTLVVWVPYMFVSKRVRATFIK
ncbi:MAG: hypothetical protein CMF63_00225 [Magnetovibrio sp.]|nr:hypothetical protein [Magnetovibrio sp.]